jgi:hypothetical protein
LRTPEIELVLLTRMNFKPEEAGGIRPVHWVDLRLRVTHAKISAWQGFNCVSDSIDNDGGWHKLALGCRIWALGCGLWASMLITESTARSTLPIVPWNKAKFRVYLALEPVEIAVTKESGYEEHDGGNGNVNHDRPGEFAGHAHDALGGFGSRGFRPRLREQPAQSAECRRRTMAGGSVVRDIPV